MHWLSPTGHPGSGVRRDTVGALPRSSRLPAATALAVLCSQLSLFPGTQPTFPEVNALTGGLGGWMIWAHGPATLPLGATGSLVQLCSQAPCGISYASVQITSSLCSFPGPLDLFSHKHTLNKSGGPKSLSQFWLLGNLTRMRDLASLLRF